MNILFVTSEAYPLIKTGGLADVSGSLPRALLSMKQDVRILLPAYQSVKQQLKGGKIIASTVHYGQLINIVESRLPGTRVKTLLVDCPAAFDRPGNPYLADNGEEWLDNAFRFALFCQVAVDIALNRLSFDWPVDVVHCNDWQSALVPALLQHFAQRPATLFTIHNMAYQGLYPAQQYFDLGLPYDLWHLHGLEYHGMFSFIKGALSYADCINTVSPQYAQEIQTEAFGYGLQGLLQHRSDRLSGVLNGIDTEVWNPASDPYLEHQYNRRNLSKKIDNKLALQQRFGLRQQREVPLCGLISRLVAQKGLDLILQAMPQILELPLQLVFLGSGEAYYEQALSRLAEEYPERIAVYIGYDEKLSHQIEAASDIYLMPSLFEPCGLNQLYSLRYGTLPLVTAVGGLLDSVTDSNEQNIAQQSATGFIMAEPSAEALTQTLQRAIALYHQPETWQQLQINAMSEDHSWKHSAEEYLDLYRQAIEHNA